MEHLAAYVAAILRRPGPREIVGRAVETSSWQDQGFVVTKEVTDFRFDDGAVIRRTVEQDDFPSEQACAECWITYEVLAQGTVAAGIDPPRVVFANACREAFWLDYHLA